MSKAERMFNELGYIKVDEPHKLKHEFNDFYLEDDVVYEFWIGRKLSFRVYFIRGSWGFSADDNVGFEFEGTKLLEAILQQIKELEKEKENEKI